MGVASVHPSLLRQFNVTRVENGRSERVPDDVAAEEPLEIRVIHWFKNVPRAESLAITMRTPGDDRELTAGFLLSEGIIRERSQIVELRALGPEPSNEMVAALSKDVDVESWRLARNSFISSSCGVCGKRSREAIPQPYDHTIDSDIRIDAELIARLPDLLRSHQRGFAKTGGLHAAALVNAAGDVEAVFEDIGRHNALDKLIGHCVLSNRIPLDQVILFLSSRSSFELIQKAVMARAPVLATVGGPSSLAIETARQYGLTLLGFVRDGRFNVYSGEWRINS